jgi:hypothetical protein
VIEERARAAVDETLVVYIEPDLDRSLGDVSNDPGDGAASA